MKAEERHELKENNLQNWLRYSLPVWLKQNGSYLILAVALAVLGYQLWNWYENKQLADSQGAMVEVLSSEALPASQRPTKLLAVLDEHDAKIPRAFAMRDLANAYLETVAAGITPDVNPTATAPAADFSTPKSLSPSDKEDTLNRAQAEYERILKLNPKLDLVAGPAALNLAVIAVDRGDWASAKKQYEAIADKTGRWAGTPYAQIAEIKLKNLSRLHSAPRLAQLPVIPPPPIPTQTPSAMPSLLPSLPSALPPSYLPPAEEPATPATAPGAATQTAPASKSARDTHPAADNHSVPATPAAPLALPPK